MFIDRLFVELQNPLSFMYDIYIRKPQGEATIEAIKFLTRQLEIDSLIAAEKRNEYYDFMARLLQAEEAYKKYVAELSQDILVPVPASDASYQTLNEIAKEINDINREITDHQKQSQQELKDFNKSFIDDLQPHLTVEQATELAERLERAPDVHKVMVLRPDLRLDIHDNKITPRAVVEKMHQLRELNAIFNAGVVLTDTPKDENIKPSQFIATIKKFNLEQKVQGKSDMTVTQAGLDLHLKKDKLSIAFDRGINQAISADDSLHIAKRGG